VIVIAMSDTLMQAGMLAGIVLGAGGLGIALIALTKVALLQSRVEHLEERQDSTPLVPAAIREFAEAPTDPEIPVVVATARRSTDTRPTPYPRTDTEENDMPRQLEAAKLESERVESRQFISTAGEPRFFNFKAPE
jgi:hypothetical protein